MRDLVELAYLMAIRAGSPAAALKLAEQVAVDGAAALGMVIDDETSYLIRRAGALGVVDAAGQPNELRCAELIALCDLLSLIPIAAERMPPEPRLVFTAPGGGAVVEPQNRLDLLVIDVIRMATREVMIGGPYWNEEGFGRLLEVLTPAVEVRDVRSTFYVHTPSDGERVRQLHLWIASVNASRPPRVRWYNGPRGSLMHAKFVVADRTRGYVGTANLTSLGLEHHVELGVELGARQSEQLCNFIEDLDHSGLFGSGPAIL